MKDMERPEEVRRYVVDRVRRIAKTLDEQAETLGAEKLLRPEIAPLFKSQRGEVPTATIVHLAIMNDLLKVIESGSLADGHLSDDEVHLVMPIVQVAQQFYGRALPRRYGDFAQSSIATTDTVRRFLASHRQDSGHFGSSCKETEWLGLDVCHRLATAAGSREIVSWYEEAVLRLMDDILAAGAPSGAGEAERRRLCDLLDVKRRLATHARDVVATPDARLSAFLDPRGPAVFHAVAHTQQIWERDPLDVETIDVEAREAFQRVVDRTLDHASTFGSSLLILGDAGSGKTHLMRAFRAYVHGRRLGFAAYLQMSSSVDDYTRYVLAKLIDSLERPLDPPEVADSALLCLAGALLDRADAKSREAMERIRREELDVAEVTALIDSTVDRLLSVPGFEGCDPDVVKSLLYLERRDPPTKARVLKFLRGEPLSDHDRRILGGLSARQRPEDALVLLREIGRVIRVASGGVLVFLVDQLEEIYNVERASYSLQRRPMDVLRSIQDEISNSVVVVACLGNYYQELRTHLTRSLLDRLERDPQPIRLRSGRSTEEIEAIVSRRLAYLFEKAGCAFDDEQPCFPFAAADLGRLAHMRVRDVLDWCRDFQGRCIDARQLVPPDPPVTAPSPQTGDIVDLAQKWNDHLVTASITVPDDDVSLALTLSNALEAAADEIEGAKIVARSNGPDVHVEFNGARTLASLVNRGPQGGALAKQVEGLIGRANGTRPVLVRCSEFPTNPTTLVAKRIGQAIAAGGARVVVDDAEWREMIAFSGFALEHRRMSSFREFLMNGRPMTRLRAIREILALEDVIRRDHVSPSSTPTSTSTSSPTSTSTPAASPGPIVKTHRRGTTPRVQGAAHEIPGNTPKTDRGLRVGELRGLRSEPVYLDPLTLTTHSAFLGSSGSGKTTLALNLVEQLLLRGIPAILVDRKGDLAAYASPDFWQESTGSAAGEEEKAELRRRISVHLFTPGEAAGRPLGLPIVPVGLAELAETEQSKLARIAADALGGMMGYRRGSGDETKRTILAKALQFMGAIRPSGEVTLSEIVSALHDQDPSLVQMVGHLDIKHFRKLIENLEVLRLNRDDMFSRSVEPLSVELLLGLGEWDEPGRTRLSILSTRFLGDNGSIEFWVARLLLDLIRYSSKHPSGALQAAVLFDEADLYLPAQRTPPTKEPMQDLLRRARSAGLSIMLATQSPADLDYRCRDNIGTWFLGRITQDTAIQKMKPLLSECRVGIEHKLAAAKVGEFFQLSGGSVSELKARRSLMSTRQLPEHEIARIARATRETSPRS